MKPVVNTGQQLVASLREKAGEAGFEDMAIIAADKVPDLSAKLREFVAAGYHGEMDWLSEHIERRAHPAGLWPDVRSVIMLGMNYGPAQDPLNALERRSNGVISVFAGGKDYHTILNKRLKRVAGWLHRETGEQVKIFVDTAPVSEKQLAALAGLGWRGKHSNIVSRRFGSWLFLGAIFTSAELPSTSALDDHCGSCQSCLDICPTGAFVAPYKLDARRCISYLSIEYKGHIALELRERMGNHIFGCDDCLAVCPWNKFAQLAGEQRFHVRPQCDNPPLAELLGLDEAGFAERFKGTPVKRARRDGLVRNVLIACGNSGDKRLISQIEPLLEDEAAIVRAMAVWALSKLSDDGDFAALKARRASSETDRQVVKEWQR